MSFDVLSAILVIPAVSAALLAVLPGYRQTAKLNVVAALATFLMGDGAGYITGTVLPVDGGLTAMMGVHRS